jgi:hypothetical protein
MAKEKKQMSRREFIKKAAYIPPVVLTLAAAPAFIKAGSGDEGRPEEAKGKGKGKG